MCIRDSRSTVDDGTANMGMIGFDIACKTARSGSRMQRQLVNDICKKTNANSNRIDSAKADYALAA